MPELPTEYAAARFRRMTVAVACLLPLCGMTAVASAQGVPAGLRACAAETDPGQRLDCYDREMKRLMAPVSKPARPAQPAPSAQAKPAPAPPVPAAPAAVTPAPARSGAASIPSTRAADAAAPTPAAGEQPATPHRSGVWKLFSGGGPSRVTARIVRVDRSPGSMVLHLDNGQVWRQTGRASGELGLRTGDEVTIAKHLGSYWLSSTHVSDMRVQRDSR